MLLFAASFFACAAPEPNPQQAADTGPLAVEEDPDPGYTIMVIPDTQYMSLNGELGVMNSMMSWILENKDELDIRLVLQEGDLTHQNTESEWEYVEEAFSMLDGEVPYVVCVGNHDWDSGDTTLYNQYMGIERQQSQPTFYATLDPDTADNHAHRINIDGVDWLVISLEYTPDAEHIAWASELIADHPSDQVIVLTHAYLHPSDAEDEVLGSLQEDLIDAFPNVRFTFSGHWLSEQMGAHRERTRTDGSKVVEMFANYQDMLQGGWGRMRQLHLNPELERVEVRTCNAFDHCSEDPWDNFTLEDVELGW